MKTHNWLRHAVVLASGPLRGGPGKHSAGTARAWAVRGVLVMVLALGAVVAALSGHGSASHANAHKPGGVNPVSTVRVAKMPWMY